MMVIKGRGQCFLRTEMIKKIDLQDENNLSHYIDKDNQGWLSLVHILSLSLSFSFSLSLSHTHTHFSKSIVASAVGKQKSIVSSNVVAFPCYQPEDREFSKHLWLFF